MIWRLGWISSRLGGLCALVPPILTPCPYGRASAVDNWAGACQAIGPMRSPSRFRKSSGNTWGRKRKRRRRRIAEKGEDASSESLEALLGSIGPFWGRLGSNVGAMFGSFEAYHGLLEPLCLGCILSRIGSIPAVLPSIFPFERASVVDNWARVCETIGPCVPRVGLDRLRGTRGEGRGKGREGGIKRCGKTPGNK